MGGSGGGGFSSSRDPNVLRAEVQRDLQQAQREREINALLTEQLALINGRDVTLINSRLDEIQQALGDRIAELDRLLFGGSVAKHTYVDGLSDVDSLVVLKPEVLGGDDTPQTLIRAMVNALRQSLDMSQVAEIREGFAVTIRYHDGNEIQLLPAVQRGSETAISDKEGTGWSFIRPKEFQSRLTEVNRNQDQRVVPCVKLAKAIVDATLAEADRPGGYHMEALAVDAFRDYSGPRSNRAMLTHFFTHARDRILRPLADVTGQSSRIDEVFGPADSPDRQRVSAALGRVATRMEGASGAESWRQLFE